ncbi:hypothetical protein CPB85DRAFT_626609 [Mucidula mucida]|nr:hypothetical protein CPB85DRAFT_626609 [Mucidula mucida]
MRPWYTSTEARQRKASTMLRVLHVFLHLRCRASCIEIAATHDCPLDIYDHTGLVTIPWKCRSAHSVAHPETTGAGTAFSY